MNRYILEPGNQCDFAMTPDTRKHGGPCGVEEANDASAFRISRYATGLVPLTVAGAGAAIACAASDTVFKLGTAGVEEDGGDANFPTGYKLALCDTDLTDEGAFVEDGHRFRIVGVGARVGVPFSMGADPFPRTYAAFWQAYMHRLLLALDATMRFSLKFGRRAQEFELGRPSFHPSISNVVGASEGSNFGNGTPQAFNPLRLAALTGARKSSRRLELKAAIDHAFSLSSDTGLPTVAGDYFAPVLLEFYGHPVDGDAGADGPEDDAAPPSKA